MAIRFGEPWLVPGLFQTPEYTRAVIRSWEPIFTLRSGNIQRKVRVFPSASKRAKDASISVAFSEYLQP